MWDSEAGLQYLRARYYDPEIGRFLTRDSITGVIENPLSQNRYTYAWNNPINYTDPSGHWPELLDDAVDSAVNFGRKVVNTVVDFGRSVVNTVTSFFTGSGSQTDARRTRTSSTSAGSGKGVPTANSTVKRTRSAGSFGSTVKCPNNLGVKEVVSALSRLWDFFGPDEMSMIEFQAGLTASAAAAYQSNLFNGQSKLIPGIVAALSIQVGSKIDNVSKWLTKMFGRGVVKVNPNKISGSGTNLRRYFAKDGVDIRINSGHGYNRTHRTGSVAGIGSMDEIESVIINDIVSAVENGLKLPTSGSVERVVIVNGKKVGYNIMKLKNGEISVSTYFPK